jgi:hypothetical protein
VRASAGGGSVMVTRRELGDRGGEFAAEMGALDGRPEADLGVDREHGEALSGFARAAGQFADFAQHAGRQRDQVPGRQAVFFTRISPPRQSGGSPFPTQATSAMAVTDWPRARGEAEFPRVVVISARWRYRSHPPELLLPVYCPTSSPSCASSTSAGCTGCAKVSASASPSSGEAWPRSCRPCFPARHTASPSTL